MCSLLTKGKSVKSLLFAGQLPSIRVHVNQGFDGAQDDCSEKVGVEIDFIMITIPECLKRTWKN